MKTSTPKKTTANPKKSTSASTAAKPKKVTPSKPEPDEEAVRQKAHQIYLDRMSRGESATPEEDWDKALKALKKSKK